MLAVLLRILPIIIAGTALCSLANIILSRNMSATEYGAFSFFLSTINIMAIVGLLGFQQTLPRFLLLYSREERPDLTFGFVIAAIGLVIVATILASAVGIYAVIPLVRNTASHQCLSDGYYLGTAFALVVLFAAYLTYHKQSLISVAAGPDGAIYQIVLIISALIALLLPHTHSGLLATEAVAAMGVAVVTCLAVLSVWSLIKAGKQVSGSRPQFRLKQWLAETVPIGSSALLGALVYSADIVAVRLIAGSESAAAYAVTSSLASFVLIPRSGVTKYFSQEAPHVGSAERKDALQRLTCKVLGFNLVAALSVAAAILALNQILLGFYGQAYTGVWPTLLLLVFARTLEGPAAVGVKLMNLEGHGTRLVFVNLFTGFIFIGLLVILVSLMGLNGAALAVIAFTLLSNGLLYRQARRYTGVRLLPCVRVESARTPISPAHEG